MKIEIKRAAINIGSIIFMLGLCVHQGAAQNFITKTLDKSHIRFNATAFLSEKLDLDNSGTSLLSTSIAPGGEATVLFSTLLFPDFRLNAGFGWSVYSYNYSFHFLKPPGSIFDTGSNAVPVFTTRGYDPHVEKTIYTVPITFQKTFQLKNKHSLGVSLEAGIKINIKESFPYTQRSRHVVQLQDDIEAEYFSYEFESYGKKTFVSYLLKAGLIKENYRRNLFYFNIVYHFSPAIIGIGAYEFSNLGFESFGTMKQQTNYLGIEIGYGLSLKKKKYVKEIKA